MKTLKDHVIIYDDECPMCDLYTCAFVKTKMLDKNGREAFSWLPSTISKHIDREKARNQIALVNPKTGRVLYGIDSLFEIIGTRFPLLRPLFGLHAFRFVMGHIYCFVSYNRRVIVPAGKFEGKNSCTPDFSVGYRIAYIVFTWFVVSLILSRYSILLTPLIPPGSFYREFLICGGQVLFQAIVVAFLNRDKLIHYLGNMMTISLAGGLLLMPMLWISSTGLITSAWIYALCFVFVAGLMFLEHIRRTGILGISWMSSFSWALYRGAVLLMLL